MFIEFNNVSKEIKKRKLLNNVNFQVSEQSIIALEGINGSGKTLILEALLGLIKVSGTIKINGNIVDTTKPFPIKAGIMIENPSIIEEFNAYQNLDLLRQLDPEVHTEKITELLTYFETKNQALFIGNEAKIRNRPSIVRTISFNYFR